MLSFVYNGVITVVMLLFGNILLSEAQDPDVKIGDLFMLQLTKASFFTETDALQTDPVRFTASKLHHPDTPEWLHFLQRDHLEDGFLYGAPRHLDDSVALEVVAVNQRSFQTAYKIIKISILPSNYDDAADLHIVELWIQNHDVEELLKGKHITVLTRKLTKIWPNNNELRLVDVVSMATKTGRVPVPAIPGLDIKDGVILQIGGPLPFSDQLEAMAEQIQDGRCNQDAPLKIEADRRFSPDYDIDWCKLKLMKPQLDSDPDSPAMVVDASPWIPRSTGIERQDLLLDFILTVVVPLGLGVLLLIILSYIMCGRRQGKSGQDQLMSPSQLEQFQSIRAAMMNLRFMSNNRDGPPSLSRAPTPGPSTVNTLSRSGDMGTALPPYRLPPTYPTHDSPGSGDPTADQSGSRDQEDKQQLMHPGSLETLKVRK